MAEEGGAGKVDTPAGLLDGVDAVVSSHPGDRNAVNASSTLANVSAKFRFHGKAAHAAAASDRGRSALDAVESSPVHPQNPRADFDKAPGPDFKSTTRLGDCKPALDYRK